MMSDYEEDLDDFPADNTDKAAESFDWSISRRVDRLMDSTNWDHYKNSTTF